MQFVGIMRIFVQSIHELCYSQLKGGWLGQAWNLSSTGTKFAESGPEVVGTHMLFKSNHLQEAIEKFYLLKYSLIVFIKPKSVPLS